MAEAKPGNPDIDAEVKALTEIWHSTGTRLLELMTRTSPHHTWRNLNLEICKQLAKAADVNVKLVKNVADNHLMWRNGKIRQSSDKREAASQNVNPFLPND